VTGADISANAQIGRRLPVAPSQWRDDTFRHENRAKFPADSAADARDTQEILMEAGDAQSVITRLPRQYGAVPDEPIKKLRLEFRQ